MIVLETRTSEVAIVGRIADELTRQDVGPRRAGASLRNHRRQSVGKEDGYFVFANLAASPPSYDVELAGPRFQTRRLSVTVPGVTPAIDLPGEDELQVIITGIVADRVSFATMPFVARIEDGAAVLGPGAFVSILVEPLEGVDVDGAELMSATGLVVGQALRIVRSTRLVLRPGPYYPFPESTTVVAIKALESMAGTPPIADAQLEITAVDGAAVSSVVVAGVTLYRAAVPDPPNPAIPFMIGTQAALRTFTSERGDAVFYYASNAPLTALTLSVSKPGYVTQMMVAPVQQGERTFAQVQLVRS